MFEDVPMEKLTINLPPIELARIDILIESGIYPSRSEFIRSAIRNTLDNHNVLIESRIKQITAKEDEDTKEGSGIRKLSITGIWSLDRKTFEDALNAGEKLRIHAVGMLFFQNDIDSEIIKKTVESIRVYGVLKARRDVRATIKKIMKQKLPSVLYGTLSFG